MYSVVLTHTHTTARCPKLKREIPWTEKTNDDIVIIRDMELQP
jgi:hypothetical protein